MKLKALAYAIIAEAPEGNKGLEKLNTLVNFSIFVLIVFNIVAVILETVPDFALSYSRQLKLFESVSLKIFVIEYLLRIWSCTEDEKYRHPVTGRLRFSVGAMQLVDLVAIIPFFVTAGGDTRIIRILRLVRLFRIFKLARYSEGLQTLLRVFAQKRAERRWVPPEF